MTWTGAITFSIVAKNKKEAEKRARILGDQMMRQPQYKRLGVDWYRSGVSIIGKSIKKKSITGHKVQRGVYDIWVNLHY